MPLNLLLPILLKYVLPAIIVIVLAGIGGYEIHDNGRQVERVVWQAKALQEAETNEAALKRSYEMRMEQAAEHQRELEELQHAKAKAINDLDRDIAVLSDRGLFIPASSCPSPGGGETKDTGGTSGSATRIRLPKEIEDDLISLAADAQRVVIQYNSCRTELKDLTITEAPGASSRRPP